MCGHLKPVTFYAAISRLTIASILPIVFAQKAPLVQPTVAQPTWSHDIAPLVYNHCTTCHHTGGAGPFSLLTYSDARRWAPQMVIVTQSRFMPPWLPEQGYGDFADVRRLSDHDVDLIQRWVKSGMSPGDLAAAPAPPRYDGIWALGKPDLILRVPRPFELRSGGSDVFHNFILPYPLKQSHYIRAMEIVPGTPQIVHHANVIIDRVASLRRQHSNDWQNGVPGMELLVDSGNHFDPDSHFLFWKPDTPVLIEPPEMPWRLDPGNDLVLNMHFKPSGRPEVLDAQVGLYFTDKPPIKFPMLVQLDRDDALQIPAGDSHFVVEDQLTLPVDVDVLGVYPHAHYLGHDLEGWATLPNGEKKWLVWIRNWDIDRQSVYRYKAPIYLPKGSVLHMRYVYDNSAKNVHNPNSPPIEVRAGNRSVDEMSHLWVQVLPVNLPPNSPDPRMLLEEAWMRHRLHRTPDDYISLYNLGSVLASEGKSGEATNIFQQILRSHPNDGRSWNALGTAVELAGNWQEAQGIYAQVLAAEPANCDARFNLASLDLRHDLAAEAETSFHDFLANCPDDVDARFGLGSALLAEQQYEQAEAEFLSALALNPMTSMAVDLREHLALAYRRSGRLNDGITQLREAIKLDPGEAVPHALLAQLLAQTGQLQEAIAEEKLAIRLDADDADGWNNLGVFEARSGRTEAARHDFQQALRIDPNNAQAKANLAHFTTDP
jgi:Flp pilus assembly protein TadD